MDTKTLLREAISKSTCKKHPLGILIVTPSQEPIMGWNGPNENLPHDKCLREGYKSGEGLQFCTGLHAEVRGVMNAAKIGVSLMGATIYMSSWFPCDNCAKVIIESGIRTLVTPDELNLPENSFYNFRLAERMLRGAGVEIIVDKGMSLK